MNRKTNTCSAIVIALTTLCVTLPVSAAIYVKIPGIPGDVKIGPGGEPDWMAADSFSFGVEREMKESGEKGGTTDINIGLGELQECTISKSMDNTSTMLSQAAITGENVGACQVCFSESDVGGVPVCYAHYVMERCFVKSWSTSGDADDRPTEEVAFYFNKIAFGYDDSGRIQSMSWQEKKKRLWTEGEEELFRFGPDRR